MWFRYLELRVYPKGDRFSFLEGEFLGEMHDLYSIFGIAVKGGERHVKNCFIFEALCT